MRSIIVLLERMCKIYANQLKTIFHFYLQLVIDDPSVLQTCRPADRDIQLEKKYTSNLQPP